MIRCLFKGGDPVRRSMVRKLGLLFLILIILVFVSGCETISTMKTGDVKMRDLVQIAKLGTTSPTRPFHHVRGTDGRATCVFDFQKINDWFQTNFW